jgi:hypothetical protein
MDFTGAKVLFAIILIILIVFAGAVPPAYKQFLDTWYGRLLAAAAVLAIARLGGWYVGVAAAITVLVLLPTRMREGFVNMEYSSGPSQATSGEGFRGGVLETGNDQTIRNFTDYNDEDEEGFYAGADKKQTVPEERRQRWFIEGVLDESPELIETDTVETQAGQ